ncbi:MAG: hypothetical protein GY906_23045 [bacterium]|nr:hypothetical protein [bacterium]
MTKFITDEPLQTERVAFSDIEANGLDPDQVWCGHVKSVGGPLDGSQSFTWNGPRKFNIDAYVDHLIDLQRHGYSLVFHNGLYYDIPVLRKLTRHADELIITPDRYLDTLVMSRSEFPRRQPGHSLADWGPNLGFDKIQIEDEQWERWDPLMVERCAVDVEITEGVFRRVLERFAEDHSDTDKNFVPWRAIRTEHLCAIDCAAMSHLGMTLDVPYSQKLLSQFLTQKETEEARTLEVFQGVWERKGKPKNYKIKPNKRSPFYGAIEPHDEWFVTPVRFAPFNPSSDDHIAKVLTSRGWTPKVFTLKGRPKINDETLAEAARTIPDAYPLIEYRHTVKKIGQLNAPINSKGFGGGWLQHVSPMDNRVRPHLNHCGTNTWRPSCAGPNLQQVEKSKEMRSAWLPTDGWYLVGADAEGIELRALGHYMAELDGGSYARAVVSGNKADGTDPHTILQRALVLPERDDAKTSIYAFIYGAQFPKLGSIMRGALIDAGIDPNERFPKWSNTKIGEWMADRIRDRVPGLIELKEDVTWAATDRGYLYGLLGHRLWVDAPYAALNVLFQAAGATIMKVARIIAAEYLKEEGLVDGRDYRFLLWVHDEYQVEAATQVAAEIVRTSLIRAIIDAGPELDLQCELGATAAIGTNWSETH